MALVGNSVLVLLLEPQVQSLLSSVFPNNKPLRREWEACRHLTAMGEGGKQGSLRLLSQTSQTSPVLGFQLCPSPPWYPEPVNLAVTLVYSHTRTHIYTGHRFTFFLCDE